jgi:glycogen debranching enzyme
LLLGSVLLDDNGALVVDLANADFHGDDGKVWLQRDSIHASRVKFLCGTTCYERIRVRRFAPVGRRMPLEIAFDADFADLFEVRGDTRPRRGILSAAIVDARTVRFTYLGLDAITRCTTVHFDPAPDRLSERHAYWDLDLDATERTSVVMKTACTMDGPGAEPPHLLSAYRTARRVRSGRVKERSSVSSSNDLFNNVIDRAASDIDMLLTQTEYGLYPYAGIPWYSTVFGRDGIITALEVLWLAPDIARGVLAFLAATQATDTSPERDCEPGKILHEARGGEMAALGEVPFGRYYGSIDATPLYVMLAAAYYRRTGDLGFLRSIAPAVQRALDWLERYGDVDGDGLVEYARHTPHGLVQQGWKDSHDSVFHQDGRLAEAPIALVEVQAYVFGAWQGAAEIASALAVSDDGAARALGYQRKAESIRARFEKAFWDEELGTYVLALDGEKRPCRVASSNVGHALWTGIIADPARARRVADGLMGDDSFSGWGIRTIPSSQVRYNPMAYHNGSVWPHDNAIIAAGFSRYGFRDLVVRLLEGMKDASVAVEMRRLPELICGFPRRPGEGPTQYPVACAPQAWASGSVFMLLSAALGLSVDGCNQQLTLSRPVLPASIPTLRLTGLPVGGGSVDLLIENHPHDVGVTVLRRDGDVRVIVVK